MICAGLLVALAAPLAAAETLEEKFAAKMAKPFTTAAPWVLDYEEALKQARETGKPVFAYFTRSYHP
jgi:hypothetical protein